MDLDFKRRELEVIEIWKTATPNSISLSSAKIYQSKLEQDKLVARWGDHIIAVIKADASREDIFDLLTDFVIDVDIFTREQK